jgi:hypothetical protein
MSSPPDPTSHPNPPPQGGSGPIPPPENKPTPKAPRPGPARWHAGDAPASADANRGVRRFIALALLLAAAGAVGGALFWIRPADPLVLLTFPIGEYKDPVWPPNPWAEEDSDALQEAFPNLARGQKEYNYQELTRLPPRLHEELQTVKPGQPVVLHLTALGAVHDGIVYILPGDAKPGDPSTWLKLDVVLDALMACPAQHRLLLLDLAHPIANFYHGPLTDNVSTRLDEHLKARAAAGKLPYFVITSCSKDELSLPMDEERQSAFAFYLGDGLRGAADGFGPAHEHDGRVRVEELAAYVARRVGRWANDCRGVKQTPKLYGDFTDFDLTDRRLPPPEPPAVRTYPPWLLGHWKLRDDWNAGGGYRTAPVAVNGLQIALIPAEQDWQAMSRPERIKRVQDKLQSDVDQAKAMKDQAQAKETSPPPLRTVTAWLLPPTPPAEMAGLIESFLTAQIAAMTNPKEAEKAKEDRKTFVAKAMVSPETRKTAAALIWRRLLDDASPPEETVVGLSRLLDEVQPTPPTVESQAARRLAAWQRPGGTPWPPGAARQMLHTEDAVSRALAAAPAAFPAVAELFAAAASLQEKGENHLFDVSTRSLEGQGDARDILKEAESAFVKAAGQLAVVQAARRAVEDAALVLPATADRVAEEGKSIDERAWFAAAKSAIDLNERLEHLPVGTGVPVAEWESATGLLTAALQSLQARYQPTAVKRRVDDLAPGRAPEYQALHDLLRGPMLAGVDRKRVWETAEAIASRVHKQTRDADAADNDSLRPPGVNRAADPPLKDEQERRDRRARVSVELLRIAGLDKIDELDAARRSALADQAKWETLAGKLRAAWTDQLPQQAKARRDARDWPAADRRERFLLPSAIALAPSELPAAVQVHRADQSAYLKWLEAYYRSLGRLRQPAPNARAFYDEAAEEVRTAPRD